MITPSSPLRQLSSWQNDLAQAISDPAELLEALQLPKSWLKERVDTQANFPLRVTQHYLSLIQAGDPHDPLLLQVLPQQQELIPQPGFTTDPVADSVATSGNGLLHKYAGRALLISTGACAIHCRYCFRRHYPYGEDNMLRHWESLLAQLSEQTDIDEVILSGGDPLTLSDHRLAPLIEQIAELPHIQRLRLHSRVPLVLPNRITPALCQMLENTRLHVSMVLHCNHPQELAEPLDVALMQLRKSGVTLLNQSVLLRGVNDQVTTLKALSEKLFAYGILPYYLHLLDPVSGAAHFNVPTETAKAIEEELRSALPGYLLPRWVRDVPGHAAKTPLNAL